MHLGVCPEQIELQFLSATEILVAEAEASSTQHTKACQSESDQWRGAGSAEGCTSNLQRCETVYHLMRCGRLVHGG